MVPDIFGFIFFFGGLGGAAWLLATGLDPRNYAKEAEKPRQRIHFSLFGEAATDQPRRPRHAAGSEDEHRINEVIRRF